MRNIVLRFLIATTIISDMPTLKKIITFFQSALFPPLCLSCKKAFSGQSENNDLCARCLGNIQIFTTLFCPVCHSRLPENKKICHKDSRFLLGAATRYQAPIKDAIHYFKYRSWDRLAPMLGVYLVAYLRNLVSAGFSLDAHTLIPLPLHPSREKERGFNQSELLAEIISKTFNLPLEKNILIRAKNTRAQAELTDWEERQANLQNAFTVANPENLKGKNIILVDDVYTSGATMSAAAEVMRAAGAKKIIGLVLAKTR